KAIEKVLVEEFGAKGRGLYANMASSRIPIPQAIQRRIRYVAAMRNKSVHELRFDLGDPAAFTERCARIVEALRELHAGRELIRTSQIATPQSGKPWAWGIGAVVVLLLAVGGYVAVDRHDAGTPAAQFEAVRSSVPAASPAAPAAPPATDQTSAPSAVTMRSGNTATAETSGETRGGTSSGTNAKDGGANNDPGSDTAASTAPPSANNSTGYYGVANEALRIEAMSLHYQKNTLSRQQPLIELSVRNTSATTLSHVLLDARLFINDGAEPVLVNGRRPGANQGPLYAGLGEAGLAVGETRVLRLYAAAVSDWGINEVRNAKSRRLVLRVAEVFDSKKH
ncbi:MAG: hypothetical protein ABW220_11365, partial [Burkholderiaceae bacterium]